MATKAAGDQDGQCGKIKGARFVDPTEDPQFKKYEDLPNWYKDNQYIRGYYRSQLTISEAAWSIFWVHNESLNIWSHLIAALWFLGADWIFGCGLALDVEKQWPLILYRFSAVICFLSSAVFHTWLCVSEDVYAFLAKVDYLGILIFLSSGGVQVISIAFYKHRMWNGIYSITGGIAAIVIVRDIVSPKFLLPQNRVKRAFEFVLFAALAIVPLAHARYQLGVDIAAWRLGWPLTVLLAGVAIYATRIPESFGNGSFDLLPSHAFFHAAVFLASVMLYRRFVLLFLLL